MDQSKKRKMDENGVATDGGDHHHRKLSPQEARKIVERFSTEQLLDILGAAVSRHADVLDAVRSVADADVSQRKLFVRGLGWDTTTDGLRSLFSAYGEIDEAVVILDKNTGKSKGYGFVTFRHVDGALLALKEPSKKIDGRMTVTQLAAAGNSGNSGGGGGGGNANSTSVSADVSQRKIYVANVPYEMAAEKLLAHFGQYGEIEEGPLGFDKQTGKCRGYALFVYKTPDGARAALVDSVKTIDGLQMTCKLAIDGKKGKQGGGVGPDGAQGPPGGPGDGMGVAPQGSMPGQFGPGGMGSYGGFSGGPGPMGHHHPGMGGPGLSSAGGQGAAVASLGGTGGYGAGLGGPYGGYGGPGAAGYGGLGGAAAAGGGLGGPGGGMSGSAGNGGLGGGASGASSLYRMPPSSAGMPTGGYQEGGHYGLSSAGSTYPVQHHHQQSGASPVPRVPPGGMYPPPYY